MAQSASAFRPAAFYFYRDQLPNDAWQSFYHKAEQAIGTFSPVLRDFKHLSGNSKDYRRVLEYVYNDHPEFFYFQPLDSIYKASGLSMTISIGYSYPRLQAERMQQELDHATDLVLSECFPDGFAHLSELHREKKIFDWISDNVTYDHDALEKLKKKQPVPNEAWTAYGALVQKKAVCQGISCAFKLLCDRLGMPSIIVTGNAGERHAWNIVRIVDRFYQVDCTWMLKNSIDMTIPYKRYQYLNVPDEVMLANHTPEADFLPRCKSLRYNPYQIKGLCCTSTAEMYRIAWEQLNKGMNRFAIMCINGRPPEEELERLCASLSRECGKNFVYSWEKTGIYVGFEVR